MSDNFLVNSVMQPLPTKTITFYAAHSRPVLSITSDGRLEKAEGYSTEQAAQLMFDAVSEHLDGIWKKVRDENAALRKDLLIEEERSIYWRDNENKAMAENAALRSALTTLLAWEDKGGDIPPTAARGLFRIARAALDSARKEAQP